MSLSNVFQIVKQFLAAGLRRGALPFFALPKPRRDRPMILFAMEKWCDCNPAMRETNSMHNLVGSLRNGGNADWRLFFYDKFQRRTGRPSTLGFLRAVARSRPDMVLVTIVPGLNFHPSPLAMWLVSRVWKVPLVFCWFDFIDTPLVRGLAMKFSRLAQTSVVLDAPHTVATDPVYRKLFIPLWTPQDQTIFRDRGLEREYDVCFMGSRAHYPDRRRILERLRRMDIKLFEGGGQRENFIGVDEYAEILSRSKIVINFSRQVGGSEKDQNKGRVYEAALCGAAVLEQRNAQTSHWLTEGVDMACFGDEDEAVAKVRHLLEHERERSMIATAGSVKCASLYNDWRFWETIIVAALPDFVRPRAIDLKLPPSLLRRSADAQT